MRSYLAITCQKCGFKYRVKLDGTVKCHNCGVEGWLCHHCGFRFNPEKWCGKCHKPICPLCGACECKPKKPRFNLILICDHCGGGSQVKAQSEFKCPKCGWDKWKCWVCGEWQPYEAMCLSCGWFICRKCGSCSVRRHKVMGVEASC